MNEENYNNDKDSINNLDERINTLNKLDSNIDKQRTIKKKTNKFNMNLHSILSFIAYIGIGFIAVALLLTLVFKGDTKVANVFSTIGQVIAYMLSIILAYSWVKNHKQVPWIVCYVIFVVTIVVLFILTVSI